MSQWLIAMDIGKETQSHRARAKLGSRGSIRVGTMELSERTESRLPV